MKQREILNKLKKEKFIAVFDSSKKQNGGSTWQSFIIPANDSQQA